MIEMCIQKFVRYTFSNKAAYDRVMRLIDQDHISDSTTKLDVYLPSDYDGTEFQAGTKERDALTFPQLKNMWNNGVIHGTHIDKENLFWKMRKTIDRVEDIFGEIELETMV